MALTTGPQLRAARAMARLDQEKLAERAGVAANTIRRMEAMDGTLAAKLPTIQRLQRVLEAAGVEFTNGDRPGVRMREPSAA
jgi:transcriptional regulator with XRE-family HTH domain